MLALVGCTDAGNQGSRDEDRRTAETTGNASGESSGTSTTSPFAPAPKKPPAKGEVLGMLSTFPEGTIAAFEPGKVGASDRYEIEYQPFGAAPATAPSLVIKITKSTPTTPDASLKLQGQVVIAEIGESTGEGIVTKGGTFRATLGFAERSGVMVAVLTDIRQR